MVLLAWTAVDLTATRLCAADAVAMATTSPEARPDDGHGPASGAPARQSHIDDCFCCSHCVSVAMPEPLLAVTADTPRHVTSRVRIPFDDGHPLYHPPQRF